MKREWKWICGFLVGVLLLNSPESFAIENLLTNGDFETVTETGLPGWTYQAKPGQLIENPVYSGSKALTIRYPNPEGYQQLLQTNSVDAVPGKSYVLTGWYRCDVFKKGDWGYPVFSLNDNASQTAGTSLYKMKAMCGDGKWHKLANTLTAKGDKVFAKVGMFGPQPEVTIYFDDLRLFQKEGNESPIINPTANHYSGTAPLTVDFLANGEDVDGAIQYYRWKFGDGSESEADNPTYTFHHRGSWTVSLTAWDQDGASVSKTVTINVTNTGEPEITLTGPSSTGTATTTESEIILAGTVSSAIDTEAPIERILWDQARTGEVGEIPVGDNWATEAIPLAPGRNEVLITATDTNGKVGTKRVVINRSVPGPSIQNVTEPVAGPGRYGKYEIRFDVETVSEVPFFQYDESAPSEVDQIAGVTVEGIFTTPAGKTVTVPGFLMTETVKEHRWKETNRKYWMIRFTPEEEGDYQGNIQVTDQSGTSSYSLKSFTVTPSNQKGFIQVSGKDSRYFEHTTGETFFPVGPANLGNLAANGNVLNFARPWMGGTGAYSTNWSRWLSSSEKHGNEGVRAPLHFQDHYPGRELSLKLVCDRSCGEDEGDMDAWRLWMGWLDHAGSGYFEKGKKYRVKLRMKIRDLIPQVTGIPHGVTMKTHGWINQPTKPALDSQPEDKTIFEPIHQTRDWHTIVTTFTPVTNDPYFSIYLTNTASGEVYIDEVEAREIDDLGNVLSGNMIRNGKADMHTYVDPAGAAMIDQQVKDGENNGVYFKYVVQDKNDWIPSRMMKEGFFGSIGNGYYQKEGTRNRWIQKQWWRYLTARWGYSTSIHSWELNNEGAPTSTSHYQATQDFANFFKTKDPYRHIATTSFWCCWKPDFWKDRELYPDVAYADLHNYTSHIGDATLRDEMERDLVGFHNYITDKVKKTPVGIPVVVGETGISSEPYYTILNKTPNPGIWYHNLIWAQLDDSGVQNPLYWWASTFLATDKHYFGEEKNGESQALLAKPFVDFIKQLNLNNGNYQPADATHDNPELRVVGQKDLVEERAHLWIQNGQHTWYRQLQQPETIQAQSGTITMVMNPNRGYTLSRWDTWNSKIVAIETVMTDHTGIVTISVENLADDMAILIEPERFTGKDSDSWPQLQRDANRSGYVKRQLEGPFHERWRREDLPPVSMARVQPIIAEGLLFLPSNDGKLYAYKAGDGAPAWSIRLGGPLVNTAAYVNGKVVVGSVDSWVYAVNVHQRAPTLAWKFKTRKSVKTAPLIAPNGLIYIGSSDRNLYALNPETGEQVWKSRIGAPIYDSASYDNGKVFVGGMDGKLYALSALTGKQVWSFQTSGIGFRDRWPVSANGQVIATPTLHSYKVLEKGSHLLRDKAILPWEKQAESIISYHKQHRMYQPVYVIDQNLGTEPYQAPVLYYGGSLTAHVQPVALPKGNFNIGYRRVNGEATETWWGGRTINGATLYVGEIDTAGTPKTEGTEPYWNINPIDRCTTEECGNFRPLQISDESTALTRSGNILFLNTSRALIGINVKETPFSCRTLTDQKPVCYIASYYKSTGGDAGNGVVQINDPDYSMVHGDTFHGEYVSDGNNYNRPAPIVGDMIFILHGKKLVAIQGKEVQ